MVALQRLVAEAQQKAHDDVVSDVIAARPPLVTLQASPAPVLMEVLQLVHTPQYLQGLEKIQWLASDDPMPLQLPPADQDNSATENT